MFFHNKKKVPMEPVGSTEIEPHIKPLNVAHGILHIFKIQRSTNKIQFSEKSQNFQGNR